MISDTESDKNVCFELQTEFELDLSKNTFYFVAIYSCLIMTQWGIAFIRLYFHGHSVLHPTLNYSFSLNSAMPNGREMKKSSKYMSCPMHVSDENARSKQRRIRTTAPPCECDVTGSDNVPLMLCNNIEVTQNNTDMYTKEHSQLTFNTGIS